MDDIIIKIDAHFLMPGDKVNTYVMFTEMIKINKLQETLKILKKKKKSEEVIR